MDASILLSNITNNTLDESIAKNIENKHSFSYIDSQKNRCDIKVLDTGIYLFEQAKDHSLELDLTKENCAKIITSEGTIKILAKVVDFIKNDDILVMRYQIEDETYELKIIYRS